MTERAPTIPRDRDPPDERFRLDRRRSDRVVFVRGAPAERPDRARGFVNDPAAASRPGRGRRRRTRRPGRCPGEPAGERLPAGRHVGDAQGVPRSPRHDRDVAGATRVRAAAQLAALDVWLRGGRDLRQSSTSLAEVLARTPQPVRFVNSFGLGDPPDAEKVASRRAMHPTVGFKLDVVPSWTQEIMDRIAAVEGVTTIDFKGQHRARGSADEAALVAMYERTLTTFDEVVFEDRAGARRCSRCSRRSPIASPTMRRSPASSRSTRPQSRCGS